MKYRKLLKLEIAALEDQGCYSDNWTDISVKEDFIVKNVINTRFSGQVSLGVFEGSIEVEKGISKTPGIYNSYIQNCKIDDNVYISDVKSCSNYVIQSNVSIENVSSLVVNEESVFGNGTEIEVFNEGGGRELPIFDKLSAQLAYLTVTYRHDKELTSKLLSLINNYVVTKKSTTGLIESGARIQNSLIIRNVNIGAYAHVLGSTYLENGTISSCKEAQTLIGEGVTAKHFIVLSGSKVDGGAMLDKSFVGQSVKIGKQYSSENSAFFANCEGFHGEACSLFAGPYTVSHHKSTLMIAGLFSFYNAGSGTNQSNHMYKLGPLHQGILERGSKTGSFSYLLWPCRVGAYTAVVGKHYANFDTTDFPFSYITEEKGKSMLTPAMNLFTVGTRRDSEKWPSRDRRTDPEKLDFIHFELFSPYIVGKIVNAINILNNLLEGASKTKEFVTFKAIQIPRLLLKNTRKYYEIALKLYMGREIVKKLEGINSLSNINEIKQKLSVSDNEGQGKWVDILGLYSPETKIQEIVKAIKSNDIKSIHDLDNELRAIYNNYENYAWNWCFDLISNQFDCKTDKLTIDQITQIVTDWKINSIKLNNMILKDAEKEFDENSSLGFGIDGDEETKRLDFESVRGTYADNKFVLGLKKESKEIEEKAEQLISQLNKLKQLAQ